MARLPKNSAGHRLVKNKAMMLLKQKKQVEGQLNQTMTMQFNMQNTSMQQQMIKDSHLQVQVMADAAKEMKDGIKTLDIDNVHDVMDDMADVMDDAQYIQDAMSEMYGMPDVNDAELDAELDALNAMDMEAGSLDLLEGMGTTPVDPLDGLTDPSINVAPTPAVRPCFPLPMLSRLI